MPHTVREAIYVDGGKNVIIEDNNVQKCNYGIELASERNGWNTEGIIVRRNTISGSDLAGISLGGGSKRNGGVTDSVVEDDLRGNHALRIITLPTSFCCQTTERARLHDRWNQIWSDDSRYAWI